MPLYGANAFVWIDDWTTEKEILPLQKLQR